MDKPIFQNIYAGSAAILIAALFTASFGCESDEIWREPGPEDTFEQFLMDWYRGDREAAFEAIAPDDRRELLEAYDTLEEKLDAEHMPEKSDMLVAGRVDNPYDLSNIELEQPLESAPDDGDEVTLTLEYHDGREGNATLLWGGDRWYVDLPLAGEDTPDGSGEAEAETDGADEPEGDESGADESNDEP
ncbi:MAG: hypothetical protein ACLFVJ_03770 [Persicimonas sp.]